MARARIASLERGGLVGAAALADGFAVAVAAGGEVHVHFLASDGSDAVVHAPLVGNAVAGMASDGSDAVVHAPPVGNAVAGTASDGSDAVVHAPPVGNAVAGMASDGSDAVVHAPLVGNAVAGMASDGSDAVVHAPLVGNAVAGMASDGSDAVVHAPLVGNAVAGMGSDAVVHAPLVGNAVPGIASDGVRVLIAATVGGQIAVDGARPLSATLLLIARQGGHAIDLGAVAAAPTPWGDARGFIVAGSLLVDADGNRAPAPGHQVRDARVFSRPFAAGARPTRDTITLDGVAWLSVAGLVGWAGRDAGVTRLEVVGAGGRMLVEVGDDLTPRWQRALPATARGDGGQSWIAGVSGSHVVWGATVENDPVFATLDASAMRAEGGVVRIRNSSSRTTIVSPGSAGVLLAWTEDRGTVRYAVETW